MIDRILAPLLTFVMLIGATGLIASSLFSPVRSADMQLAQGMPTQAIVLDTVVITAQRAKPEPAVARPEKQVPAPAAEDRTVPPQRVQG